MNYMHYNNRGSTSILNGFMVTYTAVILIVNLLVVINPIKDA